MIEAVKKQFSMQWKDWIYAYLTTILMGLFGWALMYFVTGGYTETKGFAGLGGILAAAGLAIYTAIMAIGQMWTGFNMAVSMNSTRRHFFVSYYLVIFAGALIGLGLVGIIGWAENNFYKGVYPGQLPAIDILAFLKNYGILIMAVLVMALGFCGTLLLRFGRKAFWVMWAAWMIGFLGVPRVIDAAQDAPGSVFGIIGNKMILLFRGMPEGAWVVMGIILGAACLAGTYGMLQKQQVNV